MPKTAQNKEINLEDIKIDPNNPSQAIKYLEEAMIFWHDEGIRIIKALIKNLNDEGMGRQAAEIAKIWRGVDDRWIEIAAKLAPYQSAKLSSIEVNKKIEKRFVIAAPSVVPDNKTWLEKVEQEQKLLPKPQVIKNIIQDDTIDEAEYYDVNSEM